MNTRQMLKAAKQEKIDPVRLQAHVVWALVSQMGRGPLEVGEVASLVKQTSDFKPSTYQANKVLRELRFMMVARSVDLRRNAKGIIQGWEAYEAAIALLHVYRWAFHETPEVWNAICHLTEKIDTAARAIEKHLKEYNAQIDAEETDNENES